MVSGPVLIRCSCPSQTAVAHTPPPPRHAVFLVCCPCGQFDRLNIALASCAAVVRCPSFPDRSDALSPTESHLFLGSLTPGPIQQARRAVWYRVLWLFVVLPFQTRVTSPPPPSHAFFLGSLTLGPIQQARRAGLVSCPVVARCPSFPDRSGVPSPTETRC